MEVPRLRRRILRNRPCSTVFRLGDDVYVVGGYLRDLFLRGIHSRDMDFVAQGNFRALAAAVAKELGGRAVELKKERMTRVVLEGGVTLDFSRMEGDINQDLAGRDFTINAMAWSPADGLIDPHGGITDIKRRAIRAISEDNLKKDPVRLLRAFRFSAELGMAVERRTRVAIRALAPRIRESASERITLEFFKLLNSEAPSEALYAALSDGILNLIIPLNNNMLRNNIKLTSNVERNIKKLHEKLYLKDYSQGLTLRGLLRLERLTMGTDLDSVLLVMSTDIRKRLETSLKLYDAFKNINNKTSYEIFDLFAEAGNAASDLLVLTGHVRLMSELKRFERIQLKGLLKAEEIVAITGVAAGPRLGRIIRHLKRLRFARKIRSKRDARRWLLSNISY